MCMDWWEKGLTWTDVGSGEGWSYLNKVRERTGVTWTDVGIGGGLPGQM